MNIFSSLNPAWLKPSGFARIDKQIKKALEGPFIQPAYILRAVSMNRLC